MPAPYNFLSWMSEVPAYIAWFFPQFMFLAGYMVGIWGIQFVATSIVKMIWQAQGGKKGKASSGTPAYETTEYTDGDYWHKEPKGADYSYADASEYF